MSYREDFSSLDINPRIIDKVIKAKLKNFAQVLTSSRNDLIHHTKLSERDIVHLQKYVACTIFPCNPITAFQIFTGNCPNYLQKSFLSSGCDFIDDVLKEGFVSGMLTEISGESAAGKSQLCLQLCLTVQLPKTWGGLDGKALYVSTESAFPIARLADMTRKLKNNFQEISHINFLDDVFLEHAINFDDLLFCLNHKAPLLLSEKNVKLIVIDSVTAIIRTEWEDTEPARNKKLRFISNKLRELASTYNIPVIVVNQVVDCLSTGSLHAGNNNVIRKHPALGLAWSSMMNVRIYLARTDNYVDIGKTGNIHTGTVKSNIRTLEILSAPHIPHGCCRFYIDEEGLKGLRSQ